MFGFLNDYSRLARRRVAKPCRSTFNMVKKYPRKNQNSPYRQLPFTIVYSHSWKVSLDPMRLVMLFPLAERAVFHIYIGFYDYKLDRKLKKCNNF